MVTEQNVHPAKFMISILNILNIQLSCVNE